MHNHNPLSKKELLKKADSPETGADDFSYEELGQPPTAAPKEQTPPSVKEEPKKEEPKAEEPKKEEETKKGSHPTIDEINKDWGKYWTSDTSGLEAAMGKAFKDGKATCNANVSFNGGDWAAQGVVEIVLTRDANKLWVVINPQGLLNMMGNVADKYASAKETTTHAFQPLRFLPRILELLAKKVSSELEYKLKGMGLKGSDVLDFKMGDAAAFKEAIETSKNSVNSVATEHASTYQGAAPKEKKEKKPKKLDTDTLLEKFFDSLPASDWESHENKSLGIRTKTTSLPPEKYSQVREILEGLPIPMGKAGPYQFERRQDGNLLVIDTSAYAHAGWTGPELTKLAELVGNDLSRSASASIADLIARFPSSKEE